MKISPSSSESRLTRYLPVSISSPSSKAPVRPVSSSTVKSASTGPCSTEGSIRTASAAAMPIPQSAPSVVPSALTHPPSMRVRIGSRSKSNSTSEFFSQTMSICDWRITVGRFSKPGVAGLRITTLPTASFLYSRLCFRAKSTRNSMILPSFFEGRGTRVMASNCSQTMRGSRLVIADISYDKLKSVLPRRISGTFCESGSAERGYFLQRY